MALKKAIQLITASAATLALFGLTVACDRVMSENDSKSEAPSSADAVYEAKLSSKIFELAKAGIPMPKDGEAYEIDKLKAQKEADAALAKEGSRKPFDKLKLAGFPLLPLEGSSLRLAEGPGATGGSAGEGDPGSDPEKQKAVECITLEEDDSTSEECIGGEVPVLTKCEKACVTACASATATAVAFAYAEASVSVCAFASAWACVWSFDPFQKICSYSRSQACASAFAKAFGFGVGFAHDSECKTSCTK